MPIAQNDTYTGTAGQPIYAGMFGAPVDPIDPEVPPLPPPGALVTTFALDNWGTAGTKTLFRGGMPFKKGDVPAGYSLQVLRDGEVVAAQFDERATWTDGSLKFAVCHMRDTDMAASTSRTYNVHTSDSPFNNTGATTLASVAAAEALTVEVSSLSQWNGTTSATRGAGAALASFGTHAAVATRVTKIHSGPVCEGWQVWGMVKDGVAGAGAEDAHLKVIWYVDVWKNAGGTIIDTEFGVELAQDWYSVANKFRLDYAATLKRNGTTVQAYTGIQHPYQSHWFTARLQNDNNHGKRHWAGAIPSLLYKPQKSYWVTTGVIPSFDTTFTPPANPVLSYAPIGGVGHRTTIDMSGGYEGRGMMSNYDARAFMRQTAPDTRTARVAAFAGLHIPQHYRDERTRARPSETADVANTIIPSLLDPKPSSAATFAGLPAPKYSSSDGRTAAGFDGGFVQPQGGQGVWINTSDSAHAVNYAGYTYLLEGERYMLETVVDMAAKTVYATTGNIYGNRPNIQWYFSAFARAEMSIPGTEWSGLSELTGQERSVGLSVMLFGYAAALVPDNDISASCIRAWNAHQADYLAECINYMPPSLKAAGALYPSGNPEAIEVKSPWMISLIVQGCAQNFLSTEVAGFKTYGDVAVKSLIAVRSRAPYDTGVQRLLMAPKRGTYAASNLWFSNADVMAVVGGTISANRLTMDNSSDGALNYAIQNGDRFKFSKSSMGFSAVPIPPEYPEETIFFAINASGFSCDLSLTSGGVPVTLTAGTYTVGYRGFGGGSVTPATFPPYLPYADQFASLIGAGFTYAERAAMPSCPPGTHASQQAFLANVDRSSAPVWKLQL